MTASAQVTTVKVAPETNQIPVNALSRMELVPPAISLSVFGKLDLNLIGSVWNHLESRQIEAQQSGCGGGQQEGP